MYITLISDNNFKNIQIILIQICFAIDFLRKFEKIKKKSFPSSALISKDSNSREFPAKSGKQRKFSLHSTLHVALATLKNAVHFPFRSEHAEKSENRTKQGKMLHFSKNSSHSS